MNSTEKDHSNTFRIRPTEKEDQPSISGLLIEQWGSVNIVTRRRIHIANQLPGFIAFAGREVVGLGTYRIENDECELVSLNSLKEGMGVGTAEVGCQQWTPNDFMKPIIQHSIYERRLRGTGIPT